MRGYENSCRELGFGAAFEFKDDGIYRKFLRIFTNYLYLDNLLNLTLSRSGFYFSVEDIAPASEGDKINTSTRRSHIHSVYYNIYVYKYVRCRARKGKSRCGTVEFAGIYDCDRALLYTYLYIYTYIV